MQRTICMNLPGEIVDSFTRSDSTISWNNLGLEIRKFETLSDFKKEINKIIKPNQAHSIFKILDPENLKYIYQPRVGLSQLKSYK